VMHGHDVRFMANVFVNTKTWEAEKAPDEKEEAEKDKRNKEFLKNTAWLI